MTATELSRLSFCDEGVVMTTLSGGTALFLDHRRAKGCTAGTLRLYGYWLDIWTAWRARQGHADDLATVTVAEFRAFFLYLETEHVPHADNPRRRAADSVGMAQHSRASCWQILRALWRFLDGEDLLTPQQARFFANGRIPRPRVDEPIRDYIDEALLAALLAAAGDGRDEESARNRAIFVLLYESGLRVSELCSLLDEDVQFARDRAKVWGKGRQRTWVFWGTAAKLALGRYLHLRQGPVGGKAPLFRGLASTNKGQALTDDAVRGMVKRLAAEHGIELPKGAPVHGFRHGFAHALLDEDVEGPRLQQLLRHKDAASTRRYTKEHPDRLQRVHQRAFSKNNPTVKEKDETGPERLRQ
jgi:site-specific recombinase XerD